MNKAEAKRRVYASVLALLSASLSDEIVQNINDYSEADQKRIEDAISDLQVELERRARGK